MTIQPPLVEAAVDTLAAAVAAADAGAHRLELCARLDLDGLTPDDALVRALLDRVRAPVMVMIRPRADDFVSSARDVVIMEGDIQRARASGATGVVLGAITDGGQLDLDALGRLMRAAGGMPVTFHRAFDRLRAPGQALAILGDHGVQRVLTSGAAATAWEGRAAIRGLVERAPTGLHIVAGGGVRADHVAALVRDTGVAEVHLAASRRVAGAAGRAESQPDPERLRAVLAALAD